MESCRYLDGDLHLTSINSIGLINNQQVRSNKPGIAKQTQFNASYGVHRRPPLYVALETPMHNSAKPMSSSTIIPNAVHKDRWTLVVGFLQWLECSGPKRQLGWSSLMSLVSFLYCADELKSARIVVSKIRLLPFSTFCFCSSHGIDAREVTLRAACQEKIEHPMLH